MAAAIVDACFALVLGAVSLLLLFRVTTGLRLADSREQYAAGMLAVTPALMIGAIAAIFGFLAIGCGIVYRSRRATGVYGGGSVALLIAALAPSLLLVTGIGFLLLR